MMAGIPLVWGGFAQGGMGPWFATFFNTTVDLRFASSVNKGSSWTYTNIDTGLNPGTVIGSDLVVVSAQVSAVVYRKSSDLNFAITTNGGTNWTITTIDTGGNVGYSLHALSATSYIVTYGDNDATDIKFAITTNSGTNWTISTIESSTGTNEKTALFAVSSSTFIAAYRDSDTGLKFAISTNTGSSWTASTVDSEGTIAGAQVSIWAVSASTFIIAYYSNNGSTSRIKFAISTNTGSSWTLSVVEDDIGSSFIANSISLFAVTASTFILVYRENTDADLRFAISTNTGSSWTTSTVDANIADGYCTIHAFSPTEFLIGYRSGSASRAKIAFSSNTGSSWTLSDIENVAPSGSPWVRVGGLALTRALRA